MSHRPWSEIRERALAGLTPAERAVREDRVAGYRAEIDAAIAAFRVECPHTTPEPLLPYPEYAADMHCRECGVHLPLAADCPSADGPLPHD